MAHRTKAKPQEDRRFTFGYSGLSYDKALEQRQALLTGLRGVHFPMVLDQKEREERVAVLNEILLETRP